MKIKDFPKEVWAMETSLGFLARPALDDDGTDSFLAWPSKEEAEQGMKFQIESGYYESGRVVRLVPPENRQ